MATPEPSPLDFQRMLANRPPISCLPIRALLEDHTRTTPFEIATETGTITLRLCRIPLVELLDITHEFDAQSGMTQAAKERIRELMPRAKAGKLTDSEARELSALRPANSASEFYAFLSAASIDPALTRDTARMLYRLLTPEDRQRLAALLETLAEVSAEEAELAKN